MQHLRLFSKNQIRNNKKTVKFRFTVFVISLCFNLLLIMLGSYVDTVKEINYEKYGEWKSVLPYIYDKEEAFIKNKNIHGLSYKIASIQMKDKDGGFINMGTVAGLDEEAEKLFHLQLLNGRLPEKAGEIAVEATVLSSLGIDYALNEKISIPVDQGKIMHFTLTGIIKPFRYRWCLQNQDMIPSGIVKMKSDEKMLWLSASVYDSYYNQLSGQFNTFAYNDELLPYLTNWRFLLIICIASILLLVLIMGITRLLFAGMKQDFIRLDHMGISTKDARSIRKWILFYTSIYSVPAGLFSAWLLAFIVSQCVCSFYVSIPYVWCLLTTCFMMILMYFSIPVKKHRVLNNKKHMHKHPHVIFSYQRFNSFTYTFRMMSVYKLQTTICMLLTCIMLIMQTYCFTNQVKLLEKSQMEMSQQEDYDYIVTFNNYYFSEDNPKGINSYGIRQLQEIEECEDIITIKANDRDYDFKGKGSSLPWKIYKEFLENDEDASDESVENRKNPLIYGISESNYAKELMMPYGAMNTFWKKQSVLFYGLYFSTGYEEDSKINRFLQLSTKEYDSSGNGSGDVHNVREHNIKKGSKLYFDSGQEFSTAYVLRDFTFDSTYPKLILEPYSLIMNMNNFNKLFPSHDCAQYLYIRINDNADYSTDTQIMNILSAYGDGDISIQNNRLQKENIREALYKGMLLYGLMETGILIFWYIIFICLQNIKDINTVHVKESLYCLGVRPSFFMKSNMFELTFILSISFIIASAFCMRIIKYATFTINDSYVYLVKDFIGSYMPVVIIIMFCITVVVYLTRLFQTKKRM